MRSRRRGSTFIVLLLVSTLAVAAALAYQAQYAARSHRATAENVLRDYATFASWEFARLARRELNDVLGSYLASLSRSCRGRDTLPDLTQLLRGADG
jgi:Tfp pilus assembly protein PilE